MILDASLGALLGWLAFGGIMLVTFLLLSWQFATGLLLPDKRDEPLTDDGYWTAMHRDAVEARMRRHG